MATDTITLQAWPCSVPSDDVDLGTRVSITNSSTQVSVLNRGAPQGFGFEGALLNPEGLCLG